MFDPDHQKTKNHQEGYSKLRLFPKIKEQNQYKYRYDFTLSIEIDIDENDKIAAFVAFDIKLAQGNDEYNTNWFVNLFLDYDMKNASPNYKLIMETDNKEGDLAYLNRIQGYEYDYLFHF